MPESELVPDRIVRERECQRITGLSRTSRYELEREGRFPKRIRLSSQAYGWRLSALLSWIDEREEST